MVQGIHNNNNMDKKYILETSYISQKIVQKLLAIFCGEVNNKNISLLKLKTLDCFGLNLSTCNTEEKDINVNTIHIIFATRRSALYFFEVYYNFTVFHYSSCALSMIITHCSNVRFQFLWFIHTLSNNLQLKFKEIPFQNMEFMQTLWTQ